MAIVLLPAATLSLTVLPLMLFHQIQLMVCAWLARRFAARPAVSQPAEELLAGLGQTLVELQGPPPRTWACNRTTPTAQCRRDSSRMY